MVGIPKQFNSIIQKDYENKKEILYFKTDNLQLELEENVDWTLDGEYGGTCNKANINALPDSYPMCSLLHRFQSLLIFLLLSIRKYP